MFYKLFWLAIAGALGTVTRFGLTVFVDRLHGSPSPLGTLTVNLIGCFAVGLLWAVTDVRDIIPAEARLFVFVGFMGAFTTFSTLILETSKYFYLSDWRSALTTIFLQNGLGLLLLMLGVELGRKF